MKKSSFGPIVGVVIGVLVIASFVYIFITLNRLEKNIMDIQQTVVDNSAKTSAVVNFFNSAQTK